VKKLNEFTLLRPANTTVWGMGKGEIINKGKEKEKKKDDGEAGQLRIFEIGGFSGIFPSPFPEKVGKWTNFLSGKNNHVSCQPDVEMEVEVAVSTATLSLWCISVFLCHTHTHTMTQ